MKANIMRAAERRTLAFVRILVKSGSAVLCEDGLFKSAYADRSVSLPKTVCEQLASEGVVTLKGDTITCRPETRTWIRRRLATTDQAFAEQHQRQKTDREGRRINLDESPLARLAANGKGRYLKAHQIEAGERFRQLVERSRLRARVTMSYNSNRTADSASTAQGACDVSDMAIDARKEIDRICALLPQDCTGVLLDVCGFEKGLQLVEAERGWPRRSAKLVLRIGLEQLAQYYGLSPVATGAETRTLSVWSGEGSRPTVFG